MYDIDISSDRLSAFYAKDTNFTNKILQTTPVDWQPSLHKQINSK